MRRLTVLRRRSAARGDGLPQVATARRSLRQPVVRGRWLVASCGSPSYADDGPSQVAAARRTWTMARRKLRQLVVRGRWPVAVYGSPSYADDVSSQVATARRTWMMARRRLRQAVVRGRWLVAVCGEALRFRKPG